MCVFANVYGSTVYKADRKECILIYTHTVFHRKITGRGVPSQKRLENNHAVRINPTLLPGKEEAAAEFVQHGRRLTHLPVFGRDPIMGSHQLCQERHLATTHTFDLEHIFGSVVNSDTVPFKRALLKFLVEWRFTQL